MSMATTDRVAEQKVALLEQEVTRLQRRLEKLLRENLRLQGMGAEQIELNLPALVAAEMKSLTALTKPGSERRSVAPRPPKPPRKPKTGHGPTAQPNLPVEEKPFELDEPDCTCPDCGGQLQHWEGHDDVTEVVDVVQRQWKVVQCHIKKYRCECGKMDSAPGPTRMVPGGRYTPEVAITAAIDKYIDQIPLSRQVRIAKRAGAILTEQALWDQIVALADVLEPVYDSIVANVLRHEVVGVDESPVKLIQKGGSLKYQVWQVSCAQGAVYRVLAAKSEDMGRRVLAGFRQIAVVDGAAVYVAIANSRDGPILAFCWSHTRRNFLKAQGEAPAQVAEFLDLIGELYAIERRACRSRPDGDDRRGYRHLQDRDRLAELRATESRDVLSRMQSWLLEQRFIPGGALEAALKYTQKRWTGLGRFIEDPRIPLDNNVTEAGYIELAIGRRNYLGVRSKAGAEVLGRFLTIFGTCRLNQCNPEAYLRDVVPKLMDNQPVLPPHEWVQP